MSFVFEVDQKNMPEVKQGGRAKTAKPPEPVFEDYKRATVEGLKASISNAAGRFGTTSEGGTKVAPAPYEKEGKKYQAAPNWRVVGERKAGVEEEVAICFKVGARNKMAIFPAFKRQKVEGVWSRVLVDGAAEEIILKADAVEKELKKLLKAARDMQKDDDGLGSQFHKEALSIATKARKKSIEGEKIRYDKESDTFINL
jgi:hypothetical protein